MSLYEKLGNTLLKSIIRDIIAACKELEIDFFGVGALARNAWYVDNNLPARGTKDIDFGVYIPNEYVYNLLRNKLVKDFGYVASSSNAFCLISPDEIPVDLLPFGEIEENGKVLVEGKGLTSISLDGFKEVYVKGLKSIDVEGDVFSVCTIPAVILLKLIAFDDRPEQRVKDPIDISSIFKVYPDIESDFIWDEYSFLYEGELSHESVGIKVLGFEVRKLVFNNDVLFNRINEILDAAISAKSNLALYMIIDPENETVESIISKLILFRSGFRNEK